MCISSPSSFFKRRPLKGCRENMFTQTVIYVPLGSTHEMPANETPNCSSMLSITDCAVTDFATDAHDLVTCWKERDCSFFL